MVYWKLCWEKIENEKRQGKERKDETREMGGKSQKTEKPVGSRASRGKQWLPGSETGDWSPEEGQK